MELVFRNNTEDKTWQADFFEHVLGVAAGVLLETSNYKLETISLSVNLVSKEEIQKLNKEHRGKDAPTDVLSFPVDAEAGDLGDIFICLSIAKKRAEDDNMTIEKELSWLTIHGFLHLLGYDHDKSEEEARKMDQLEKQILERLKANA